MKELFEASRAGSLPRRQAAIGRRGILAAGTAGLVAAPALVRAQGKTRGVALVIGNSRYSWEAPLPNVRRDAPDIAKRFQELGLRTELLQDAGREAMAAAVEKFKAAANGQDVAVLYFAGHGASWEKDTYLVPVDSDLGNPDTIRNLLPIATISAAMQGAAHRLLIFDNCRNNPSGGWRQRAAAQSAFVNAAELAAASVHGANALLLFSTAPGRAALDGPAGQNSPFAAALLRQLAGPTTDIAALPARLRRDLLIATGGRQILWHESTYTGPFVLSGAPAASTPQASSIDTSRIVELPNAYAFAQEKKLALPPGLVAIRAPAGSPHGHKIGAFESTFTQPIGLTANMAAGRTVQPVLIVVLSVDDDTDTAQTVVSFQGRSQDRSGAIWNFWEASLKSRFAGVYRTSPEELRYMPDPPIVPFWLRWRDRDSGSNSQTNVMPSYQARFSRLDG